MGPAWLSDNSYAHAGEFRIEFARPTLDRWMYPFNVSSGCRASAPVFGTLEPDGGVDSRHGQFLLGFDFLAQTVTNCGAVAELPALLATNRGPANYLLRSVRLTATVNRDRTFALDPTADAFTSYLPTNDPAYTLDADAGRSVELFGADFRNGWNAATFWEDGPFGSSAAGQRNAFASGFDTNGVLVDVSNNVGKTDAAFTPFEVHPFAIGTAINIAPGEPVPSGTKLVFELNLGDPLVRHYLQTGLDAGRLRFMVTSLHMSAFGGQPAWPDFFTRDNALGEPPTLEIEGTLVEPDDSDGDGLSDDWERFYFGSLTATASQDADGDGADNLAEFAAATDPSDRESTLRILSLTRATNDTVTLRFPYVASRPPRIEHSADTRDWHVVDSPKLRFYAAPGVAEWDDDSSTAARFYRLHLP